MQYRHLGWAMLLGISPASVSCTIPAIGASQDELGYAINGNAGTEYTIEAGKSLYHGTDFKFDDKTLLSKTQPIWFSPVVENAAGAGFKKGTKVGATDSNFYIWVFEVKQPIKLMLLTSNAKANEQALKPKLTGDWNETKNKFEDSEIGYTMGVTSEDGKIMSKIMKRLDKNDAEAPQPLCSGGLMGWRSPWDQNEVMLCVENQNRVKWSAGYICNTEKIKAAGFKFESKYVCRTGSDDEITKCKAEEAKGSGQGMATSGGLASFDQFLATSSGSAATLVQLVGSGKPCQEVAITQSLERSRPKTHNLEINLDQLRDDLANLERSISAKSVN